MAYQTAQNFQQMPISATNALAALPSPAQSGSSNSLASNQGRKTQANVRIQSAATRPHPKPFDAYLPYFGHDLCNRQLHQWQIQFTWLLSQSPPVADVVSLIRLACVPSQDGVEDLVADPEFLLIHQIICLAAIDPRNIPTNIRTDSRFPIARKLLGHCLIPDAVGLLPREFMDFFSSFPLPLRSPSPTLPPCITDMLDEAKETMWRFVEHYPLLEQLCLDRRFQPTAVEVAKPIAPNSRVIQWITYLSIAKRCFGDRVSPTAFHLAAEAFQRSQDKYFYEKRQQNHAAWQPPANASTSKIHQDDEEDEEDEDDEDDEYDEDEWIPILTEQALPSLRAHVERPSRNFNRFPLVSPSLPPSVDASVVPNFAKEANSATTLNNAKSSPTNISQANDTTNCEPSRNQGSPGITISHPGVAREQSNHISPQASSKAKFSQHGDQREPRTIPAPENKNVSSLQTPQSRTKETQASTPGFQRLAVHQANLRSPILERVNQSTEESLQRKYQYVWSVLLQIVPVIDATTAVENSEFYLPRIDADSVPGIIVDKSGSQKRFLQANSTTFRLRCIKGVAKTEHDWVISDTCWPAYVYFEMNRSRLDQRKALSPGIDLPTDITQLFCLPNEVNTAHTLKIVSNMRRDHPEQYSVAVEVVRLMSHKEIRLSCMAKPYTTRETLDALAPKSAPDGSDDIIMSNSILVNIVDPIIGNRMPFLPVRGPTCTHRSCFDLGAFLRTRPGVAPNASSAPDCEYISVVDAWRCPICGRDARPHVLQLDEFMDSVRRKLDEANLVETMTHIVIDPDGRWRAGTADGSGVDQRVEVPVPRRWSVGTGTRIRVTRGTDSNAPHVQSADPETIVIDSD